MDSYNSILHKLSAFITKYYTTQMIKGAFVFVALALLFFLSALALEYFLWLGSTGRLVLLIASLIATLFLLVWYLIIPVTYLLRIQKGLDLKVASRIIGKHFPEVGDRLINLLDLAEDKQRSELLLASIEQRSKQLTPIPFNKAIDIRKSLTYGKYVLVPLFIIGVIGIAGQLNSFFGSYERVINYDVAYEKPAPFRFILLNGDLDVLESESYTLNIATEGEIQPDIAFIVIDGKEQLLQKTGGQFSYTFRAPIQSQDFYLSANKIRSRQYRLEALTTPSIQEFRTILTYPNYTQKRPDTLQGTGNAVVPEGTIITWQIASENTNRVQLETKDTTMVFAVNEGEYKYERKVTNELVYEVTTSNDNVEHYERLKYRIRVNKDASPTIKVNEIRDSVSQTLTYEGITSDDYKVSKIDLVYYVDNEKNKSNILELARPGDRNYSFYYEFPSGMELERGKKYSYYFRVADNDAIHGRKTAKSQVFSMDVLNERQEKEQQLNDQKKLLQEWDGALNKFQEQEKALRQLERDQKEKNVLSFNDQRAIKDFLKQQQQQEALMEKFSKQLKKSMSNEDQTDPLLKERLERQELEARKNERLLEELKKIADKLDKEEMSQRLEEIGKKQQNSKRNLEQLLELTKRYYVTEKANQLAKDLNELSERQDILSELDQEQDFNVEQQKKINNQFDTISKGLEDLRKANADLKKPIQMDTSEEKEEEVKEDLNEAKEELNKQQGLEEASEKQEKQKAGDNAKKKQRSAANKMKQMSEALQQSAMSGGGDSMAEDAEMLRQILDNLLIFSFKQEALYDRLQEQGMARGYYTGVVKEEQQLKGLFEHVDDSLFALSLRQVELTEFVNEQITEVYYNIDRSLVSLSEGQTYQGVSYQQYVLTAANNLADFLANVLGNMQQTLSKGKGSGQKNDGFQLPDIIKGQNDVQQRMEGMKQKGDKGQDGKEGEQGEQGEGGKEGSNPKEGENEGKDGEGGSGSKGKNQESGLDMNEEQLKELYEIYKEQQLIRNKLEEQLATFIKEADKQLAQRLARQMEEFEQGLLENGITQRTIDRANRIQQQLLKLENAAMEQGEKDERESKEALKNYGKPLVNSRKDKITEEGQLELLQRQVLPLQEFYKDKAKKYFKKDD